MSDPAAGTCQYGKKVITDDAARRWVRATAHVSLLWADNIAPQETLPGMRKVAQTRVEGDAGFLWPVPTGSSSTYPLTFNADSHSEERMSSWLCSLMNYSGSRIGQSR